LASEQLLSPCHRSPLTPSAAGFESFEDTLDGYRFQYPADWVAVRSAGADVFLRAPAGSGGAEENLFVEASSPSSTVFASLDQLGSPEAAGAALVAQYLVEFTSTRLGVRREAELLGTPALRTGPDGVQYLDAEVAVRSYASPQQYGVTAEERGAPALEWRRRLRTTLGVGNGRLYALRLQCAEERAEATAGVAQAIRGSFRVLPVGKS